MRLKLVRALLKTGETFKTTDIQSICVTSVDMKPCEFVLNTKCALWLFLLYVIQQPLCES
jgi:hypothetical protein